MSIAPLARRALRSLVVPLLVSAHVACGGGGGGGGSASSSQGASTASGATAAPQPKPSAPAPGTSATPGATSAHPAPPASASAQASAAPAAVSVADACAAIAAATCDKHASCDQGYRVRIDYGDVETCRSQVAAQCLDAAQAPDATADAASMLACKEAVAKMDCDDRRPAACRFQGKRADAAACSVDSQCRSGLCVRSSDTQSCGVCKKVPAEGDACKLPRDCYPDFTCGEGKCVARTAVGGTCTADHRCATSNCDKGRCGPYRKDGAACDTEAEPAVFCHFAYGCDMGPKKCGPRKLAATGEKCAPGQGPFCMRGTCNVRTRLCDAAPKAGETCDAATSCAKPFVCLDGKCGMAGTAECR